MVERKCVFTDWYSSIQPLKDMLSTIEQLFLLAFLIPCIPFPSALNKLPKPVWRLTVFRGASGKVGLPYGLHNSSQFWKVGAMIEYDLTT